MTRDLSSPEAPTSMDFSRVMPIFVLVFVDVLGLTVILPLLHLYAATYGATPFQIGLVAATFPLAQLIGVPVMGALSDRYGRKPLLLISQVSTCISFIMLGAANSLAMIVLSRVIDGIFGANLATAQAALSDITDESNRARGLGITGAAFGLGFIIGPILSLIALEMSDSLAVPALSAAVYSFISILLTLFFFKETLPESQRKSNMQRLNPFVMFRYLVNTKVNGLLVLMFAQQLIFFGFETLLGLFILSRLGLLGDGSTMIFLVVGITLVIVQMRFIGKWSNQYGEEMVIKGALALLAIGLLLFAFTPEQPHPFYVERNTAFDLRQQMVNSTEAILGDLNIRLPAEENRGILGILWVLVVVIPLSVGAGLIRPAINSTITKRVKRVEYGAVLGVSASFMSAANALAPLLGGWLFQQYGSSMPFLAGGILMSILFLFTTWFLKPQVA